MNNIIKTTFACLALTLCANAFAASTLVGSWLTIDDKTNKPRSTIEISEKDGVYTGKVIEVVPVPGDLGICQKCPGQFKDQKIEGLQILWNLQKSGVNEFIKGKILDPKSGKIYDCKVTLADDGNSLNIRGFIGISLFGRTQTWKRVATES